MERALTISGVLVAGLIGALLATAIRLPVPESISDWLTPFVAIAAIGQAFFAFWALEGLRHARTSAEAASKSLEVLQDTSQRQLRAYVTARLAVFTLPKDGAPITIKVDIYNSGQTPAHRVRFGGRVETLPINADLPEPYTAEDFRPTNAGRAVIGSNDYSSRPVYLNKFDQTSHAEYLQTEIKIVLRGIILYLDIFGREQWTSFYFIGRADSDMGPEHLLRGEHGNDAT